MITIGLDPHPGSHTVAALDTNGTLVQALTVQNDLSGLQQLHTFGKLFPERQWAIEGAANHYIVGFVTELLAAGERVTHIPPTLTSQYRARHGRKKNDVVDAQNAARALIANPELPRFAFGQQQRELQELTHVQRKLSRQLQGHEHSLEELDPHSPVRAMLQKVIQVLGEQLKLLEKHLRLTVQALMPELLDVQGIGPVVAGIILGETGAIDRYKSEDQYASYCGAAPVERGSGKNRRMQLNTAGNRRLNWALHIIAVVRLRRDERSKCLMERLLAQGKTRRHALRILKTYIAREVFRLLRRFSTPSSGSEKSAAVA